MSTDPRDGARTGGRHDGRMHPRRDLPLATGIALGAGADHPPPRRAVPLAAGTAPGAVAAALLADPRRGHPVAGFGAAAAALERRVWRDSRPPGAGDAGGLRPGAAGPGVRRGRA